MSAGQLVVVLNAHLPFVRHAGVENVPQEQWLYQAITESYIPLLDVFGTLERDRVPIRLTLSLSPALLGMLADPLLRTRYLGHLDALVELAEREERRTRADARFHRVAEMYLARFCRARTLFLDEWQRDLIAAFRAYQECGALEIITSAATHGFLPLLTPSPAGVRAQIHVAASEYRRFFGGSPLGFWLPECGYEPGLDAELARAGFRYFFVDTHGLAHATPRPVYGVYAPVVCDSGVAVFGRDPESTKTLCSPSDGYPANVWYRDFHLDLASEQGAPLHPSVLATGPPPAYAGLKYHRNTGPTEDKDVYDPERATAQAHADAEHFVAARLAQLEWLGRTMDRPPVIVCLYDAELFGRGWFEGPLWLEHVFRRLANAAALEAVTPGDLLARHVTAQAATPAASTWRGAGYNETWLTGQNGWIYRHLHAATDRLHALCRRYPSAEVRTRRALTQALRELLLAQASDWAFLMARRTDADYAVRRTRQHLAHCRQLCDEIEANDIDDLRLSALEDSDNVFPTLDYRVLT